MDTPRNIPFSWENMPGVRKDYCYGTQVGGAWRLMNKSSTDEGRKVAILDNTANKASSHYEHFLFLLHVSLDLNNRALDRPPTHPRRPPTFRRSPPFQPTPPPTYLLRPLRPPTCFMRRPRTTSSDYLRQSAQPGNLSLPPPS
ncbi:hypothetical protein E3N88_10871 [Mikania micrantha]|uniref:Uncharacterized protein n=1 Tax=Mikania micrantha TaxID=192012 RepID=A0A5N6PBU4_9ASTR|nr:hypothetical protein E3N88_10871 [Mikania micrantha]